VTHYLSVDEVLRLHEKVIRLHATERQLIEVLNMNQLEAAVGQPQAGYAGTEFYPGIFNKAAVLLRCLILDHPFLDGNKRTGLLATAHFLNINGYTLTVSQEERANFCINIAEQPDAFNVKTIAKWLERNSAPLPQAARFLP